MKFNNFHKIFLKTRFHSGGFTMLEMAIIVFIATVLAAIAAPTWHSFYINRQLSVAQEQIQGAIKQGQNLAKHQQRPYRFVIEQKGDLVRWGLATDPNLPVDWRSPFEKIAIDPSQTTFRKVKDQNQWFVVLDKDGTVTGQLGRVTLMAPPFTVQRCVIMSTLLGETRKGQNHPVKRDGFNCY